MNTRFIVFCIFGSIFFFVLTLWGFLSHGFDEPTLNFLIFGLALLGFSIILAISDKKIKDKNKKEYDEGVRVDVKRLNFELEQSGPYHKHYVHIKRKKKFLHGGIPVYVIIGRNIFSYVVATKKGFFITCNTKKMVCALAWYDGYTKRYYFSKEYVVTSSQNVQLQIVNGKKSNFELELADGLSEYKIATIEENKLPLKWYGYWSDMLSERLPKNIEYALKYKELVGDGGHINYFLDYWGLTDENDNEIFYTVKPILEQVLPAEFMPNLILAFEQFLKIRDNFKKEAPEPTQSQFDEFAEKFKTYDEYFYEHENELINAILNCYTPVTIKDKINWEY